MNTDSLTKEFSKCLADGWKKYKHLFEAVPHGTVPQMAGLLELAGFGEWVKGKIAVVESRESRLREAAQNVSTEMGYCIEQFKAMGKGTGGLERRHAELKAELE